MSTLNIPLLSRSKINYRHLLPDLASRLTLSGSNYPYLEQISIHGPNDVRVTEVLLYPTTTRLLTQGYQSNQTGVYTLVLCVCV